MPTWAQIAARPPPQIVARPPKKTGFLHLAQELQDQILEYALTKPRAITLCLRRGDQRDCGCESMTDNFDTIRNLTLVSSKIRQDALDTMAKKSDYECLLHWATPLGGTGLVPCLCSVLLRHIRRLCVHSSLALPSGPWLSLKVHRSEDGWEIGGFGTKAETQEVQAAHDRLLNRLKRDIWEPEYAGIGIKAVSVLYEEVQKIKEEKAAEARLRSPGFKALKMDK